jgi:hypothetical protein
LAQPKVFDGFARSDTWSVCRSDSQPGAAFGATGIDDGAATLGFHARAEAVGALATYDGGLIGAFHVISKVRKSRLLDNISS